VDRARGSEGVEVPHTRAGKEAVGIGERERKSLVMCIHRLRLLGRPRADWNSLDTLEEALSSPSPSLPRMKTIFKNRLNLEIMVDSEKCIFLIGPGKWNMFTNTSYMFVVRLKAKPERRERRKRREWTEDPPSAGGSDDASIVHGI